MNKRRAVEDANKRKLTARLETLLVWLLSAEERRIYQHDMLPCDRSFKTELEKLLPSTMEKVHASSSIRLTPVLESRITACSSMILGHRVTEMLEPEPAWYAAQDAGPPRALQAMGTILRCTARKIHSENPQQRKMIMPVRVEQHSSDLVSASWTCFNCEVEEFVILAIHASPDSDIIEYGLLENAPSNAIGLGHLQAVHFTNVKSGLDALIATLAKLPGITVALS